MDWELVVAAVNGTGSISANGLLAQGFFQLGYWVGTKNIFPSNISGLPTWYVIRVNDEPYTGLRRQPQVLVALNPETLEEDWHRWGSSEVVCLVPAETVLPESWEKEARWIGRMPIKETLDRFKVPPRLKKLVGNLFYVGAIWAMVGQPWERLENLVAKTFSRKNDVLHLNQQVAQAGYEWFFSQHSEPFWKFEPQQVSEKRVFMDGNTAAALGLLWGGATFAAWYPITPSTSLVETFERLSQQVRQPGTTVVVQAEDELAAVCLISGAGWQGARAFTATSGPGFSLMQEALGYAYFAEIPLVVWNIQRVGPSTGLPTRTQQADILQAFWASHGDTWHPLLFPMNLKDLFEFGTLSFDLAERLQTPLIVMSDLDLGLNQVTELRWELEEKPWDRGIVVKNPEQGFARYQDEDGDGIAARSLPGDPSYFAAYTMRGSGHNSKAQYSEKPEDYKALMERLKRKWETALKLLPKGYQEVQDPEADWIVFYGSAYSPVKEVAWRFRSRGLKVNLWGIRSLPVPDPWTEWVAPQARVWVVDLNRDAQMATWLKAYYPEKAHQLRSVTHFNGYPLNVDDLEQKLLEGGFGR